MTGSTDKVSTTFDPDAVHARYRAERDKRMVASRTHNRDIVHDPMVAAFRTDPFTPVEPRDPVFDEVDVAVLGAGMAGLLAGAKLRDAGLERIRLVDEAGGVGGTWYWNRYPGVMCDVESYVYMPLLEELGTVPTMKYAFGPEILGHFEAIAERWNLLGDALFHTHVERSEWDEDAKRWVVHTDRGDAFRAKYLVLAPGILNLMKIPTLPGMEDFRGTAFHTARWDYAYTGGSPDGNLDRLGDESVAILGTGASGIQVIPHLARAARQVFVFQRTPSAIGVRGNRPTEPDFADDLQPGWQWERMLNFQRACTGHAVEVDMVDDGWTRHWGPVRQRPKEPGLSPEEIQRRMEELDYEIMEEHRRRVDEIVEVPEKAAIVKPYYRYICKRPCFHDEYLDSLNAPNLQLVDCPAGVERVTESGVIANGEVYEVDCIIYATGFEGETTPLPRRVGHDVLGRNGVSLMEKWGGRASSLFGLMTRGFPNLFIMPAPGAQAVVTANHTLITLVAAEHIGETVHTLEDQNVEVFEVSEQAERDWCEKIRDAFVDASELMGACVPSRLNNEGDPGSLKPENGSYGGGLGDFFGFLDVLARWRARLASGDPAGLEIERAGVGS
ncbi:MAG: NAD(P)/FAD-dependent oxidoreductase [Acidimicrobiia bacterium]|jgi:cation diffusion facilitator CzcD-associated flavoprotein CzcO